MSAPIDFQHHRRNLPMKVGEWREHSGPGMDGHSLQIDETTRLYVGPINADGDGVWQFVVSFKDGPTFVFGECKDEDAVHDVMLHISKAIQR